MVLSAVTMKVNGIQPKYFEAMVTFDTDSAPIGIDCRCMGCISNGIGDFEGSMVKSDRSIKIFFGLRITRIIMGNLACKWMDNDGKYQKLIITKYFYVKGVNVRIISPQYWTQIQKYGKLTQGNGS